MATSTIKSCPTIQVGYNEVNYSPSTASTVITFPKVFDSIPEVVVTQDGWNSPNVKVWAISPGRGNFTMRGYHQTETGKINVHWIAALGGG